MKTIITYTFLFFITFGFSQNNYFNEDTITKYFVQELDSFRKTLYPTIPNVIINDNASEACRHHNKYMSDTYNITDTDKKNTFICTHGEFQTGDEWVYDGNDTLIMNFANRVKYYNTNKDFEPYGEVITCDILSYFINNEKTNEFLGKSLFNNFMESSEHKKIISKYGYNVIAIDVRVNKNSVYVTMIVGVIITHINDTEYIITKNN